MCLTHMEGKEAREEEEKEGKMLDREKKWEKTKKNGRMRQVGKSMMSKHTLNYTTKQR